MNCCSECIRKCCKWPKVSPPPENIYKAKWRYKARGNQELSFSEGDRFKIVSSSGKWWEVYKLDNNDKSGMKGIVPPNFLAKEGTLEAELWYFGNMTRLEALKHFSPGKNNDGEFMVRLSERADVGFVLSVKINGEIKHFKIFQPTINNCFLRMDQSFRNIQDLVNYYRENPLDEGRILGLPCTRGSPAPQDLSYVTVDEWELPIEQFTLDEQLGEGHFSLVYRGKWKGLVNVAIKVLKNQEDLCLMDLQMETQILKKVRHKHLISLFAVCSKSLPYCIITELMEKGNLLTFLRGDEGRSLDQHFLVDIAFQVADGMAYLESNNIIHRDLAARNVLVGEGYTCKVGDFGLSRVIKEPFYIANTKELPYKWTAPEAISHQRFSTKSDVWSFGVLLYEIFTYGGTPYPGADTMDIYEKIMAGYRMPAPFGCPGEIYIIMSSCWVLKPEDRPSFSSLKSSLIELDCFEIS